MTTDDALPAHPRVRGLYRVETIWLSGTDPKAKRPLVVLAMPGYGLTDVPLLARTTQLGMSGVPHAANTSIGCTKDGVFAFKFLRRLDITHFAYAERAQYLGDVDAVTFGAIIKWWEL